MAASGTFQTWRYPDIAPANLSFSPVAAARAPSIGTIEFDSRKGIECGCHQLQRGRSLGRWGSPMSGPSKPRMGFFPFKGSGFETFIRRDLIVRVRFFASLTFL